MVDRGDRDSGALGARQAGRVRLVGEDEDDLGGKVRRARRRDQRGHVGAAAGNQDGGALARGQRASLPEKRTRGPLAAATTSPICTGARPASVKAAAASAAPS